MLAGLRLERGRQSGGASGRVYGEIVLLQSGHWEKMQGAGLWFIIRAGRGCDDGKP